MLVTLLCKVSVVRDSLPLASLSCATVPTKSCIWLPNVAMFVVRVSRSCGTLISSGDVLNLSSTRFRLLLIVVTCTTLLNITILNYWDKAGTIVIPLKVYRVSTKELRGFEGQYLLILNKKLCLMFITSIWSENSLVFQNLEQLNLCTISGTTQVQVKIKFFPGVGKHFWEDWIYTLYDYFSEVFLFQTFSNFIFPLFPH